MPTLTLDTDIWLLRAKGSAMQRHMNLLFSEAVTYAGFCN